MRKAKNKALSNKISDKVYRENLRGDFRHHPITGENMKKFHRGTKYLPLHPIHKKEKKEE